MKGNVWVRRRGLCSAACQVASPAKRGGAEWRRLGRDTNVCKDSVNYPLYGQMYAMLLEEALKRCWKGTQVQAGAGKSVRPKVMDAAKHDSNCFPRCVDGHMNALLLQMYISQLLFSNLHAQ